MHELGNWSIIYSDGAYMLWDVDIKDIHGVKVHCMETSTWPIQHLQPLSFFYCKVHHDGPIWQVTQRLHNK